MGDSQNYAIEASATAEFAGLAPDENRDQVRLMLRTLLADRFHLRLHTEIRQQKMFSA